MTSHESTQRTKTNGPMQFHTGTEEKLLQYVLEHAENNLESVVKTIDEFCYNQHWMMNLGDQKGAIVDKIVKSKFPKHVLEMGTYCGYSSCRILSQMPPDGIIVSLEFSKENADIARQIHKKAGVDHRVHIIVGAASHTIPKVSDFITKKGFSTFDLVFIDHEKSDYYGDLLLVEKHGLITSGSVVVADNVVVFKIKDYLDHVRNTDFYSKSDLYMSKLEYITQSDDPIEDGVEVSVYNPKVTK
jgi:catechol O-methyltransferase